MTVSGYDQSSDAAWRRMFERDKDLLRQLGIPLRVEATDAFEVEHGYVVPRDDYSLADPGLTDEERAALWLAAKVVRIGGQAMTKREDFSNSLLRAPALNQQVRDDDSPGIDKRIARYAVL